MLCSCVPFCIRIDKKNYLNVMGGITYIVKLKSFKISKISEIHLMYLGEETTDGFE